MGWGEIRKASAAQERRTATAHGGRRQPGSGSTWNRKGDVKTKLTLIENKRTDAKSITLKAVDLEKICREAWAENRRPVLCFEVGGKSYVALSEDDYLDITGTTGATLA